MSLITRCPACGTMFKVVTDQLKVSQGWVRCGHCAEVFDASVHLLPGDVAGLPPSAFTPDQEPVFRVAASMQDAHDPAQASESTADPSWAPARAFADRVPLTPFLSGQDAQEHDSIADFDPASWKLALHERQQLDSVPAQPNVEPENTPPRRPDLVHTATAEEGEFESSEMPASGISDDVSFVRAARRQAFWKTPAARWSLGVLALLLMTALAIQWLVQQKDNLAALEPRLGSLLQTVCGQLRCEIRAPRHIDSLVIDSSSFNRIGPDAYRLSFVLKNTGTIPLEVPSLEVTLTDTQDRAVVRRVLTPVQFGATATTLGARSELAGALSMKVAGDGVRSVSPAPSSASPAPWRVAGYRVLAFYP